MHRRIWLCVLGLVLLLPALGRAQEVMPERDVCITTVAQYDGVDADVLVGDKGEYYVLTRPTIITNWINKGFDFVSPDLSPYEKDTLAAVDVKAVLPRPMLRYEVTFRAVGSGFPDRVFHLREGVSSIKYIRYPYNKVIVRSFWGLDCGPTYYSKPASHSYRSVGNPIPVTDE